MHNVLGTLIGFIIFALLIAGCANSSGSDPAETAPPIKMQKVIVSGLEGQETELAAELIEQADAELLKGSYKNALFLYQEAQSVADSASIWLRIGEAQKKLGASGSALTAYTESLKRDPEQPVVYQQIGLLYLNNGKADSAEKNLQLAVEMDPKLWRAWNGLGVAADLKKEYGRASLNYQQATQLQPKSPMVWSNLGYSMYLASAYGEAEKAFRRSLELDAHYKPAWTNLGLVHARLAQYDAALEILTQLQKPEVAYNDVGYIAMLNGDWDSAQHLLQRAVDLSPTYFETAQDNLATLSVRRDQKALGELKQESEAANAPLAVEGIFPEQSEPLPESTATVVEPADVVGQSTVDLETVQSVVGTAGETASNNDSNSALTQGTVNSTDSEEQGAVNWLEVDPDRTGVGNFNCVGSRFPQACKICAEGPSPSLCMLRFLQGVGR